MLFSALRKRRAIAAYAAKLPQLLVRDYGAARRYAPSQIKRTLERNGLSTVFDCYAYSMFSDRDQFDLYHQGIGEVCAYEPMRAEIAAACFAGNGDFGFTELFDPLGGGDGAAHGSGGLDGQW